MRTFTRRHPRPTACRVAAHILLGVALGLLLATVFGVALKWLWNYTMPGLFHLPAIGFCKAVALLVMARLLFGRINHGHRAPWLHGHDRHHGCPPSQAGYERWWRGCGEPRPGAPETEA
jgi:hypothetical protein